MNMFGQNPRTCVQLRRVLADFELFSSKSFRDSHGPDSLDCADGPTSHGSCAERQNRYPSPMQGLGRVLIKPLHFFHRNQSVEGIAKSGQSAQDLGADSHGKDIGGWLGNSKSWQSRVFWASQAAAIRCCCRVFMARALALRAHHLSAATRPLARRLVLVSTFSARISATAAKRQLTALHFNRATGAQPAPVAFAFANATGRPGCEQTGTVSCSRKF